MTTREHSKPTPAAIATSSPVTAAAGARVARAGGNAVDIAVASALAATLSEILMCSLGGSGFVMIRRAGHEPELLDGADAMPDIARSGGEPKWRRVHIEYGDGIDVMAGPASIAVPGLLAVLELAWKRHGRLPWREIVAPALTLARDGFPADATTVAWLKLAGRGLFWKQPASRACFFPDGEYPNVGETFRPPDMDQTLELIADEGARALYGGDLAIAFESEVAGHGGFVTREDLAAYSATARAPLVLRSGAFSLALNPPPAIGGTGVGAIIRLLELAYDHAETRAERAVRHARAQACVLGMRDDAFADRYLTDDDARMLLRRDTLRRNLAAMQSPHTTHLSVATGDGDVVAITLSNGYGAGITIPGTGITCNNSLGEPELNPFGFHAAPPGSRLVSNMSPTVAWHADGRCVAFGSPGASRITTSIAQVWSRYSLEDASFEQAVSAPRMHVEEASDGLRIMHEPGIDTSLLAKAGFGLRPFDSLDMYFGAVQLAGLDLEGLHAVVDGRRHGYAEFVR